jgi:hypothetical protein
MWHVWERTEIHVKVWWGNLNVGDHLENRSVDGGTMNVSLRTESEGVHWINLAKDRKSGGLL